MSGSYEEQLRAQQEMQKAQLQAQIDMQNQIIYNHNQQIAQHQKQQLEQLQAQTQGHSAGQHASYNPSANSTASYNPSANQAQSYPTEKPTNYEPSPSYENNGQNQLQNQEPIQAQLNEEQKEEEDPNAGWKLAAGIGGGLLAATGLAYGSYKLSQHVKEKGKTSEDEVYYRNLAMHEKANTPRMPSANSVGYASYQSQSSLVGHNQTYGQTGGYQNNNQGGGYQNYGQGGGYPQGYGQSGGFNQGSGQFGGYGQGNGYPGGRF